MVVGCWSRDGWRGSAGEEPEVAAEERGSSLLCSFCLFLLKGAGGYSGREVVKEERAFREASRREGSKEREEQGVAKEEDRRGRGFCRKDFRNPRSSAGGALTRSP